MLSITYAEYCICCEKLILSITYAEYCLCCEKLILSITYAEYCLCCEKLILSITYAEYCLCWVFWLFYPSEWVRVVGFEPSILRSIPGRGFDAFTSTLLQYFRVRSKLIKYGTNREILLKGKAQYD
jgi:hypothetical protein